MKSNVLLVLLTGAVTLLAVNLMQGRFPQTAHARIMGNSWLLSCPGNVAICFAVNDSGEAFLLNAQNSRYLTTLKR